MRTTHTYVELDISPAAFEEIRAKLDAAGYGHVFHVERSGRLTIDMHGLGLVQEAEARTPAGPRCPRHGLLKLARPAFYCEACEAEAQEVPRAGQVAGTCAWCGHPLASHVVTGGCIEPSCVTGGRCGCRS